MRASKLGRRHVRRACNEQQTSCQNTPRGLVKRKASRYVPDSKRACVYDCEQARSGTRKLRKDEKDEANHDCDSRVEAEAVSWSAERTANQHSQHEAAPIAKPGSSFI